MSWKSFHIFCHDFSKHDSLINELIEWCMSKDIQKYFFIRYWEGGPHIRLRIYTEKSIDKRHFYPILNNNKSDFSFTKEEYYKNNKLDGQKIELENLPWFPNNTIEIIPYKPEVERYGGRNYIKQAEEIFHTSSLLAYTFTKEKYNLIQKIFVYISIYKDLLNNIHTQCRWFEIDLFLENCSNYWEITYKIDDPIKYQEFGKKLKNILEKDSLLSKFDFQSHSKNLVKQFIEKNIRNSNNIKYNQNSKLARSVIFSQMHMLANRLAIPIEYEYCIYKIVLKGM